MRDYSKIHDEKYKQIKQCGSLGWGGSQRIENLPKVLEDRFFSFPKLPKSGRILELGCGAGNVSIELAKKGYQVSGIDVSATAISLAEENSKKNGLEIKFFNGSITDLSILSQQKFDVIYDGNCLHCILPEDRHKVFAEIHAALEENGLLFVSHLCASQNDSLFPSNFDQSTRILTEQNSPYRFIPTAEAILAELAAANFTVLESSIRKQSPFGHINIFAQKS